MGHGTVAVVDYGMGNLHSVRNALDILGAEACVTSRPEDLRQAERIILPGVGAFGECLKNLERVGMVEALHEEVLTRGKPCFGICLGLQVLAREGHEMGCHAGLGWLDAVVERLPADRCGLKIPHVGWNEVAPRGGASLFKGLPRTPTFYFVHSYCLVCQDPALIAATCDYGGEFVAAIERDNLFASQFHPEKSQQNGLQLLDNFLAWAP